MLTSVRWLNRYLDPADLSPEEAVRALEAHAFPIEAVEPLDDGDTQLDVELTSNRGDAFSHLNLAKDIAAATGRKAVTPDSTDPAHLPKHDGNAADLFAIENRVHERCPSFTARIIKGVKVGPSPDWLRQALEAVGQRSINNVVDVSNYVLFELGHPSHTFDLAKLSGSRLIIRHAENDESITALDDRKHKLSAEDVVVADEQRPVSIAGVIGGLDTGVTEHTTDVLLELATWDPAAVRRTARRLNINTDAAYRFARYVDQRDLHAASARAAHLIIEVAGGELVGGPDGILEDATPASPLPQVTLRPERLNSILGIHVPTERITQLLNAIDIATAPSGDDLTCTIPPRRTHELTREIDLIEEVARLHGFDHMQVAPTLKVPLDIEHPHQWRDRERGIDIINTTLTAAGFYETVTFSFLNEAEAVQFTPDGLRPLIVDRERRPDAPYLRPSVIPSLLQVRLNNQNARNNPIHGVRLFETAAVFAEVNDAEHARRTTEHRNVALLMDVPEPPSKKLKHATTQHALRELKGLIHALVRNLAGPEATLAFNPADVPMPVLNGQTAAEVVANGQRVGYAALLDETALKPYDIERPVLVAELGLPHLLALYPPTSHIAPPPAFPAIERDLSLIVPETTTWQRIASTVHDTNPALLVSTALVDTYRGKPIDDDKKSVTLRLTFRDPARTLRHEEVDPQMQAIIDLAAKTLAAEVRA